MVKESFQSNISTFHNMCIEQTQKPNTISVMSYSRSCCFTTILGETVFEVVLNGRTGRHERCVSRALSNSAPFRENRLIYMYIERPVHFAFLVRHALLYLHIRNVPQFQKGTKKKNKQAHTLHCIALCAVAGSLSLFRTTHNYHPT